VRCIRGLGHRAYTFTQKALDINSPCTHDVRECIKVGMRSIY
jgi:hypothetical protein